MKTDTSFNALLLTMVLFGAMLFLLMLLKLPGTKTKQTPAYEVGYTEEKVEEKPIEQKSASYKIETHQAFNEAKKFIETQELERVAITETFEQKVNSMDQAIKSSTSIEKEIAQPKITSKTTPPKGTSKVTKESTNRNTTISYRLVDRTAIHLPNPVYVCEGAGKIVLSIKVNESGKVITANFSEKLSTTTNDCLIEVALAYAFETTFTVQQNKPFQLGTITYQFPGQ